MFSKPARLHQCHGIGMLAVMARKNKVLHSINHVGDALCVDVFLRPDGTYGFELYRRDPEDPRGWYPIGQYGHMSWDSVEQVMRAARQNVLWLNEVI